MASILDQLSPGIRSRLANAPRLLLVDQLYLLGQIDRTCGMARL